MVRTTRSIRPEVPGHELDTNDIPLLEPASVALHPDVLTRIRQPFDYAPPDTSIPILHQDKALIVCDKPSGLLTVPGKHPDHWDCLEHRIQSAFPDARIVHRLDKDTSGVIVLARNASTHRNLGLQFERRHVRKTYIAEVAGQIRQKSGVISAPLRCDWPNRPLQIIDWDHGRPAQTHWHVDKLQNQSTRVTLTPVTGRSHQLRVHMLSIGHTVLGDRFYGTDEVAARAERLHLHASTLSFIHPETGQHMEFNSPAPF